MKHQKPPIRFKSREDQEAGLIRGFLCVVGSDGSEEDIPMSTLSLAMALADKQLFRDWAKVMEGGMVRLIERHGIKVTGTIQVKPHEDN